MDELFEVFDARGAGGDQSRGDEKSKKTKKRTKRKNEDDNVAARDEKRGRAAPGALGAPGASAIAVAAGSEAMDTAEEATEVTVDASECVLGGTSHIVNVESTQRCVHEVALPAETATHEWKVTANQSKPPAKEYPFQLDPFQQEAVKCLNHNESVLVSAHTSAGKTVVAEYAIAMSLRDHQRVVYTTPIKALSNQKYREFYEEFSDVGLMTGDVTINPSASVLVMTTEILRSMLYRGSEIMREVAWVIFDEVHYMRDKERGVVWEETMILLPNNVHYVFLSATIPNAREFARWICELHLQPCHVVYTDFRPTPLQHYLHPSGAGGLYLVVDEHSEFREDNFAQAMSALATAADDSAPRSSSGGPGAGKGRPKRKQQGPDSDISKIVKLIMERSYQPVIVFSFSKKDCETYALQMSRLDFNTAQEKALVDEVFRNATDSLSAEDKKLPQVDNILPLLRRGIGIHHGGLLPLLKETIEILFSEGLIKALFATETFAMGLNMPAKTVVFTNVRKFDGQDFRWVSSGEYIQMSGRAGRRGLDERGIVILMLDSKMEPAVGKALLKGQADALTSAFRLTYNMVLNLLRVEEINPEYMLQRSFFQYQNNVAIPALRESAAVLEAELRATQIDEETALQEYHQLRTELDRLSNALRAIVMREEHVKAFLQPGRLVRIAKTTAGAPLNETAESEDWGWGCVVNFQRRPVAGAGGGGARLNGSDMVFVVEVLLKCVRESSSGTATSTPRPWTRDDGDDNHTMTVVPCTLEMFRALSAVRIYFPKDLKSNDNRRAVLKSIEEAQRNFPAGLPSLDPTEDMAIRDPELQRTVKKIELLEKRLHSRPIVKDTRLRDLYKQFMDKLRVSNALQEVRRQIRQSMTVLQLDELKNRKRVLRRLGYTTAADVIELKGRVACEISSADELLLTEMIFNGVFNELSCQQCVSLLSCFVYQEKSDTVPRLKEELAGPLRQMQESARRIARVSLDSKMKVDEEEYVQSFRSDMMDVVFAWANGASFADVCKMTDIFEGSIIRCMRRLEELMRQLCRAAKAIGNTELENKFAEGITKIKRDIVFAASLYL